MWRVLNLIAVASLIGSAVYAYTIKYETILFAEQILKVKHGIAAEQDAIERLKAEWAILTRPDRLQQLARQNLGLQPLSLDQIVDPASLPAAPPKTDAIGQKLEALGLAASTSTPKVDRRAVGSIAAPLSSGATPSSR